MTMKLEKIGIEEARDLLRTYREKNERNSEEVLEIWEQICNEANKLGDERWVVYEQVILAALDCDRTHVIDGCLQLLREKFNLKSMRVRRLCSMRYESLELWDSANGELDVILEEDETNSQAKKRKIAILKALGDTTKAIAELNKYLKYYMFDQESWMELCDLYIQDQDYVKAIFCCEELLLHNPDNHIFYERYAEIRYTQGGFESLENAKFFYCKALKLNPKNIRALYGLLLTCSQIISSPKCAAPRKKELTKVITWAQNELVKMYRGKVKDISVGHMQSLMVHTQT